MSGGFRFLRASALLALAFHPCVSGSAVSAAELPPPIPREVIFGNPQKQLPLLAPDGTRLAYWPRKKACLMYLRGQ
jgi:hypothetical protein